MKQELQKPKRPTEEELELRLRLTVEALSDAFKQDRDGDISSLAGEIRALEVALRAFQTES